MTEHMLDVRRPTVLTPDQAVTACVLTACSLPSAPHLLWARWVIATISTKCPVVCDFVTRMTRNSDRARARRGACERIAGRHSPTQPAQRGPAGTSGLLAHRIGIVCVFSALPEWLHLQSFMGWIGGGHARAVVLALCAPSLDSLRRSVRGPTGASVIAFPFCLLVSEFVLVRAKAELLILCRAYALAAECVRRSIQCARISARVVMVCQLVHRESAS